MAEEWFRVFAVYYQAHKYEVMAAEKLVTMVRNEKHCDRTDALRWVFYNGIRASRDLLKEDGVTSDILDANCEKAKLFRELQEEAAEQSAFDELVDAVGLDRVLELAQERDIDIDKELAAYKPAVFNQTTRIGVFIEAQLRDGQPHQVSDIKQVAIDVGLVSPPEDTENHDREWNMVKQVASQMGVSDSQRTKRGYWQAAGQQ